VCVVLSGEVSLCSLLRTTVTVSRLYVSLVFLSLSLLYPFPPQLAEQLDVIHVADGVNHVVVDHQLEHLRVDHTEPVVRALCA